MKSLEKGGLPTSFFEDKRMTYRKGIELFRMNYEKEVETNLLNAKQK